MLFGEGASMTISKYCASGNDFLIFHSFQEKNRAKIAIALCNRFYGIGADGMVVILPYMQSQDTNMENMVAYKWEFYNADGSLADMCGNASRAAGLYAFQNGLTTQTHSFLSGAGIIDVSIQDIVDSKHAYVQSNLGQYTLEGNIAENRKGNVYEFEHIIMRIPHLVHIANSMKEFTALSNDLEFLSYLRHKYNANVNIALKESDKIHYVTFERGVENITQACGTGACAVYVSFRDFDKEYTLIPPSKEKLKVSYIDGAVYFAGLVTKVCDCVV